MSTEDALNELIDNPIETVQRWTEKVVSGRVGDLERQIHEGSTENARLRVQVTLDRDPELGGKWRQINQDPEFIKWLNQVDELSGAPRLQLLTMAYNGGYSSRVRHIFSAYIASQIPQRERTETRLPHEGGARQPSVRVADLQRGKIWSRAEIHAFYRDVRLGKFDKRDAERNQIEAEIIAAAKQGRMAPDAVQLRNGKGSDF